MEIYIADEMITQIRRFTVCDPDGEIIDMSSLVPGCIGVMPIYDNYNDAKTAHPNHNVRAFGKIEGKELDKLKNICKK